MRAEPYTILPDGNGRKKKRIEYARKKDNRKTTAQAIYE